MPAFAVGGQARAGVEIMRPGDFRHLPALAGQRDGSQRVAWQIVCRGGALGGMRLRHGDQAGARGIVGEVGESHARRPGDPLWRSGRGQLVDLLVLVVDEENGCARNQELAATVFMHPRAGGVGLGQNVDGPAIRPATHDHLAPLLLGPGFAPIDGLAARLHHAEPAAAAGSKLRADRRGPNSEGEGALGRHVCSLGRAAAFCRKA